MKVEIESLKKTQTKIKLEMKTSEFNKGPGVSLTNKLKEMEERISDLEDKGEEVNNSPQNILNLKIIRHKISRKLGIYEKTMNIRYRGRRRNSDKGKEIIFNKMIK